MSGSPASADQGAGPERPGVVFHDAPLATEQWEAYERAACSYACTREFIEYFENSEGCSLALVQPGGDGEDPTAFLYRLAGRVAFVLGRFTAPSADALGAFASAAFARHPRVGRIEIHLIDALSDPRRVGRPLLGVRDATEIRIPLPASDAEYERTLSRGFAADSRQRERRLGRERPSARFVTLEGTEIPRSWIAEITRLNRQRMASKNVASVFSTRYEEGIARVAQRHGCVTVLLDGERVCAGVIDIVCGPNVFGWVIGHDEDYRKYSPGRLCQLVATRHYIRQGLRMIHLLHGESQYKRDFGGHSASLESYVVLRDWASARPTDAARVWRKHLVRFARWSIREGDRVAGRALGGTAPLASLARKLVERVRRLRRS